MSRLDMIRNLEAEQAVLGSILIDGADGLERVRSIIADLDFYEERNRAIYRAMKKVLDQRQSIDLMTIEHELRIKPGTEPDGRDLLETIGGSRYLRELMEAPSTTVNLPSYMALVKSAAVNRRARGLISEAARLLREPDWRERIMASNGHFNIADRIRLLLAGPAQNPLITGLIRASDLDPEPCAPPPLWFGIYPGKVALLIGETGAGKSSVLYNVCVHAARNEPLWNVPFGLHRPLRVLYIDPENGGNYADGEHGLCAEKVARIDQGRPVDLMFHNGQGVNLSQSACMESLTAFITEHHIDLVILDPIANLFETRDENDNAEAPKQMKSLVGASRATGAGFVIVHHTGKDISSIYGRGASARLAAADTAMVFRVRSDDDSIDDTFGGETVQRADQCRLQIVKNRLAGKGSLYLRMAGADRFELSTFTMWSNTGRGSSDARGSRADLAAEEILVVVQDGSSYSSQSIIDLMKLEDIGEANTRAALLTLVASGKLIRETGQHNRQTYRLAESNELPLDDPFADDAA